MTIGMKEALQMAGIEEPVLHPMSNRARKPRKLVMLGVSRECVADGFYPEVQEDVAFHILHCRRCSGLDEPVDRDIQRERRVFRVGR